MFSSLGEFCIFSSIHFLGDSPEVTAAQSTAFYGIRSFILGFIFLWAMEVLSFLIVDTFIWHSHKMDLEVQKYTDLASLMDN